MATKKAAPKKAAAVVNPFDKGVTYPEFLKALGTKKVSDYLKDVCTESEIAWLESELEHFKKNK